MEGKESEIKVTYTNKNGVGWRWMKQKELVDYIKERKPVCPSETKLVEGYVFKMDDYNMWRKNRGNEGRGRVMTMVILSKLKVMKVEYGEEEQ